MSDDPGSWLGLVRRVGRAFGELLRAELAALAEDLGRSGRALLRALVVAAVAGAFAFWTLGLTIYLAVELLALALPRAGAVAIVFGLFFALSIGLVLAVRSRWSAIESPDATLRRRLGEAAGWWQSRVADENALAGGGAGGDSGDEREREGEP